MKKKIFFSYTDNESEANVKLIQTIKLHFSRLSNNADLLFNEQQFALQADESTVASLLTEADCKVHLLSVNYANEEKYMNQLKMSVEKGNTTFPILLSSFFWDEDSIIEKVEEKILPAKDKPLEVQPNINLALTQIVQEVAGRGLGLKVNRREGRSYFVALAVIVLALGCIATVWSFIFLGAALAVLTFLMFLCIVFIVLIRLWKPTSISLFKF